MTVTMRLVLTISCLSALLASAFGKSTKKADGDCSAADAQIAQLTAEVEALRKQLAAAPSTCSSNHEFSVLDVVSKSSSITSDVVQHLLQQTDVDDKIASVVSAQMEAAGAYRSKVVDQISAHPCSSDYNECIKTITSSPTYKTHLAAHIDALTTAAQPHVDAVMPHMHTALKTVKTAYSGALEMAGVVREKSGAALDHVSNLAGKTPDHLDSLLDPAFVALKKASPNHHQVLPKKPVDRLLLICIFLVFVYNFWFVVRIGMKLFKLASKLAINAGIKLPFKVATTTASWSLFFGTGFYVCGLCRKRKAADAKTNKKSSGSADAKSEPKKPSKPATEKDLVQLLDKAKEKGKLSDGVTRLVDASKTGKPLQAPEEMKGKEVKKDVLKKALAKYKEIDIKKLGL